jgi:hypothetical protein
MVQRLTENWLVDWSLVTGKGSAMPPRRRGARRTCGDQRARRRRVGAWGRTSTDAAAERTSSLRGSKDFRTSRVNGLIPNSSSSDVPNSISQRL